MSGPVPGARAFRRVLRATPALLLLLLAPAALARPSITRATVKVSKKGVATAVVEGRFTEADWGNAKSVAVRLGEAGEEQALGKFRHSPKMDRYRYRNRKGPVLTKARFDLRKGTFRLTCRAAAPGAEEHSIDLLLRMGTGWIFDLPVDPGARKTRFRGEILPRREPELLVLDETHPGYRSVTCYDCHTLPAPGHLETGAETCVPCHGANGAWEPGETSLYRFHAKTDRCLICHGPEHGYVEEKACRDCHYAPEGVEVRPPEDSGGENPPPETEKEWPEIPFSPSYHLEPELRLFPGDEAMDFTLKDIDGTAHRLSDLLATKPVFLFFGSLTCNVYRDRLASVNALAKESYDATHTYADLVHFVHVYVLEAHPIHPDVSPFSGAVWELEYSLVKQPTTYEGRRLHAQWLSRFIEGDQLLLVDDLSPGKSVNPVLNAYGTLPSPAFIIRRDGVIHWSNMWYLAEEFREKLDEILDQDGK